jgi:hypothetical protein
LSFHSLTVNFAFYLKNNEGTWFSWRIPSDPPDNEYDQHFLLTWESDDVARLNMEDVVLANSDKDYDDMIVRINFRGTHASVPEPTTMLLLGFGLMRLAGVRRKIKN